MKSFVCIALLVACAVAAPAPEEGKRDKRWVDHGLLRASDWDLGHSFSSYSLGPSYYSHAPIVYSAPTVIHEPAVVSVKKIVSVPRVVAVKKIVSVPHVAHYVSAPRVSYSYAPSYSSGWW